MTLTGILIVYLAFRAKQLICDFFLQTSWMALTKVKPVDQGCLKALAAHAGIHATATLLLALTFAPNLWWLGPLDFIIHGTIDRIKGVITEKAGWTYKDGAFWWAFGIDQEMHNLTHLGYVVLIALSRGVTL